MLHFGSDRAGTDLRRGSYSACPPNRPRAWTSRPFLEHERDQIASLRPAGLPAFMPLRPSCPPALHAPYTETVIPLLAIGPEPLDLEPLIAAVSDRGAATGSDGAVAT